MNENENADADFDQHQASYYECNFDYHINDSSVIASDDGYMIDCVCDDGDHDDVYDYVDDSNDLRHCYQYDVV